MAVSEKETTAVNEFHRELINRFFNPKSYFLFSFITELKSREALLENPENVAAIGLVVDEIINSENKFEKILDLTRIPGFDFFYHTLMEKVEYLRVAHLTTQQMMETVKSLGISLAESFERIMAEPGSRDILFAHVGIERETPKEIVEQIPENDKPAPAAVESAKSGALPEAEKKIDLSKLDNLFAEEKAGSSAPDPWDFFYEDVNGKLNQIDELLDAFQAAPHNRALLSEIKANFQELREWAMIQGNEGIETIAMRLLIALNLALRTFSYPIGDIIPHIREAIQALREVNKFGWAGENLDIIPVVIRHLESLYSEIKKTAAQTSEISPSDKDVLPDHSEHDKQNEVLLNEAQGAAEIRSTEKTPMDETDQTDEAEDVSFEIKEPETLSTIEPVLPEMLEEQALAEETDKLQEEKTSPEKGETDLLEDENLLSELTKIHESTPAAENSGQTTNALQEAEAHSEEEFEEIPLDSHFDLAASQAEIEPLEKEVGTRGQVEPKSERPEEDISTDELEDTVSEMERLYQEMFPDEYEGAETDVSSDSNSESTEMSADGAEEKPEEMDTILGEALDESLLMSESDISESTVGEDIQLPGAEDDDLQQIIEEISGEEKSPQSEAKEDSPEEGTILQDAGVNPETEFESPELESKYQEKQIFSSQILQRGGKDFVEEADMYFQFVQKAFLTLEKNPGLHRAYEDIELACYSLKILARKLGYISVAKITEKIEEIFKSVLSGELLLKPEQVSYLAGVVVALKKRGLENRLADEEISAWSAEVLEKLNQMKTIPDVEKKTQPEQNKEAIPGEDPLEFLMYEDTGKYFKQLLDD